MRPAMLHEKDRLLLDLAQFLLVKGPDHFGITLPEVAVLLKVLLDKDADMIEQILLQITDPDAMGMDIVQDEIDLLVTELVHQAVLGLMSNKAIIVSMKLASSLTFSFVFAFPAGLRL